MTTQEFKAKCQNKQVAFTVHTTKYEGKCNVILPDPEEYLSSVYVVLHDHYGSRLELATWMLDAILNETGEVTITVNN